MTQSAALPRRLRGLPSPSASSDITAELWTKSAAWDRCDPRSVDREPAGPPVQHTNQPFAVLRSNAVAELLARLSGSGVLGMVKLMKPPESLPCSSVRAALCGAACA